VVDPRSLREDRWYAAIDGRLGQVHAVEAAWAEGPELVDAVNSEVTDASHLRIALARGHGVFSSTATGARSTTFRSRVRTPRPWPSGSNAPGLDGRRSTSVS
jgi:hypothetical protein